MRISQQDGPANGSQPFRSEWNANVIGGWLPSLTFALGGGIIMSKLVIGAMTFIGMVPGLLFALSSLLAHIRFAQQPKEPGTYSFLGGHSVAFGPTAPIALNVSIWPSLLILFGAVFFVVGLWLLLHPTTSA